MTRSEQSKAVAIGCGVGIGLLLVACAQMPYGYYILLRLAVCPLLAWCAYEHRSKFWLVVPLVLLALVYNPLVRVPFKRDTWAVINIATVALLIIPMVLSLRKRGTSQ